MKNRSVLVMAGGTGGHIFPALAVVQQLKLRGWKIIWLGAEGAMETRIVPEKDPEINLETLKISGLRGKGLRKWLMLPWGHGVAIYKAIRLILRYRPDVVVGFGGFTSFAGGIAAKLLRKPLVIHEQNAVAGLTNRVLAKVADKVLFAFPGVFRNGDGLVGNPVRQAMFEVAEPQVRFKGRQGPLRLVVMGGSLGASVLNTMIPKALSQLPIEMRPYVLHQAGIKHVEALQDNYQALNVEVVGVPFIDDVATALAQADLVICRAGALTIAELTAVGVAAIMVPYPSAVDDHQTVNAQYLSREGAGILIPQAQLSPEILVQYLSTVTREALLEMAQKARLKALPAATNKVAAVIENLVEIT